MKVLIVDDHVIVRAGLAALLGGQPDIKVVGEAGSIREAVDLTRVLCPDVVLMDYGLPDGNGAEATQAILAIKPDTKVVILTVHDGDDMLFGALRAGAKGFLLKNLPAARLLACLRGLERNEAALSPEMTWKVVGEFAQKNAARPAEQSILSLLTLREMDILRELANYASNAEIASKLLLSEKTVKNHVHAILEKLALKNRREAAWFAKEQGLEKKNI